MYPRLSRGVPQVRSAGAACRALLAVFAMAAALISPALGETRVALVIANGAYPEVPLANPAVDATLVVPFLEKMGFSVTTVLDADINTFDRAISEFAKTAADADMALFYYAGHGFALDDGLRAGNYLMATSADVTNKDVLALRRQGVLVDEVIDRISGVAKTTLVFIDACRNDPAVRSGASQGRGFHRSLGSVRNDVFVGLSTRLGDVAADGEPGEGSPFAIAFVENMATPGLNVPFAFNEVRKAVEAATGRDQAPEAARIDLDDPAAVVFAALTDPIETPAEGDKPAPPAVPDPEPSDPPAMAEALRIAVAAGTPNAYRGFLEIYPDSSQADYVRSLLKRQVTGELEEFVMDVLVPGDMTDRVHLRRIYGARVDYYDQGLISVDALIRDKADYATRFPTRSFTVTPGTLRIEPGTVAEDEQYIVTYAGTYEVANTTEQRTGSFEANYMIDVSGMRPRIVLESGGVFDEAVTPLEARLPEPEPVLEPQWYLAEYDFLDFWGGDIVEGGIELGDAATVADCQAVCENNAECRIFTFNDRHKMCFIKRDYLFTQRFSDAYSGLYYATNNPQSSPRFPVTWDLSLGGFTYDGGNIERQPAGAFTDCFAMCDARDGCTTFTFGPFNGVNSCLLKDGSASGPRRINNSAITSASRVDAEVSPDRITRVEAVLE